MTPRIELLAEKKLVGCQLEMSLSEDRTVELWKEFGPKIKELNNRVSNNRISLQIYPPEYHQKFHDSNRFMKWAAVEVVGFENIPSGLDSLILRAGQYAVFNYKGKPSEITPVFHYIFNQWIPNSKYCIDDRPHFELIGLNYNNTNAAEEIWIPIKHK
ncbi:MAG: GyrI-like domain-containing protein [Crocinitomicaceae bacterium]|nr:GyrI-like domain-containing protein [Crocinitomicaceae bacterium]